MTQAAGAGYLVSGTAGDVATLTKLLRVALLMPLVVLLGVLLRRRESGSGEFPWFLLGFVALFAANSLGLLSAGLRELLIGASQWCLLDGGVGAPRCPMAQGPTVAALCPERRARA